MQIVGAGVVASMGEQDQWQRGGNRAKPFLLKEVSKKEQKYERQEAVSKKETK